MLVSGGVVAPADIDGDGDLDLFVGTRQNPGNYPLASASFLLINDGKGKFEADENSLWQEMGMITDAAWTDLNGDGLPDLVYVGDWEPVSIWINGSKNFERLADSEGWWNSLRLEDMDGDGDMDIIAGNLGLNSQIKASPKEPVELFYKDFDNRADISEINKSIKYLGLTNFEIFTQIFYTIWADNIPKNNKNKLKQLIKSIN